MIGREDMLELEQSKLPKYHQIREALSRQINAGFFSPGDKLPTEQRLAELYGVSRLTVRQAISQLSAEGIIRSVQGKGSFINSQSRVADTGLKTIHVLASSFHENPESDAFLTPLLLQLCHHATRRGLGMTMSILPRHQSLKDFLRKEGLPPTFAKGVVIANVSFSPVELEQLTSARIPFAILPLHNTDQNLPTVGTDDRQGIEQCLEAMLRCKHRRIAMMCIQPGYCAFDVMIDTYKDTLARYDVAFDPDLIVTATPWDEEDGYRGVVRLLERGCDFTGLIVHGDRATVGAVKCLQKNKFRIPEDVSVSVIDRYSWLDSVFPFRLCGVQPNVSGIAQALLDVLDEQRKLGAVISRRTLISSDFVGGDSCIYLNTKK